jgi:WD40 repeat protein
VIVNQFIVYLGLFCVIGLTAGCQMEQQFVSEVPTATLQKEMAATERPLSTATVTLLPTETAVVTNTPIPSHTATDFPTETAVVLPNSLPDPITWTSIGTPVPPAEHAITAENVAELTEVARWGKGQVLDAVYAPDGSKLYVLTAQGVYFYETASARLLDYRPYENVPSRMALSPDGGLLAVAMQSDPRYVELRNAVDNTFITAFLPAAEAKAVRGLHFDQSGETLFIHVDSVVDEVIAWDIAEGEPILALPHIDNFAFAPQAGLAAALADGATTVQVWPWQNKGMETAVAKLTLPETLIDNAGQLAISPDGQYVALAQVSDGIMAAVWRVADESLLYTINADTSAEAQAALFANSGEYISDMQFSADSMLLAAATNYQNVAVWQIADGTLIQDLPEAGSGVTISPDNQTVAGWKYALNQWQVTDGAFVNSPTQHIGPINDLTLLPTLDQLTIASSDKFTYLRHVVDGSLAQSAPIFANTIDAALGGETLVAASAAFHVWQLTAGSQLELEPALPTSLSSGAAISYDGRLILGKGRETPLLTWQRDEAGNWVFTERPFFDPNAFAFSPTDYLAALTDFDEGLLLWHPEWGDDFELLPLDSEIEGMTLGYVNVFNFSPDSRYLAAGTHEGFVLLWEIEEREATFVWAVAELDSVLDVAFSPDNALVAIRTPKAVVFVGRENGRLLHTLSMPVVGEQVVFGENGRYLYTGHRDGSVRLWSILHLDTN